MTPKMLASEAAIYLEITVEAIRKQLKTKELDYTKSQNKIFFGNETAKKLFKLALNPTCFSWQNLKGGVGKTSLSFATAVRLSLYGAKVVVLDLDEQGNFTLACGVDAENSPVLIDIINDDLPIDKCLVNVLPGLDILPSRIDNGMLDNIFAFKRLPVDRELKRRVNLLKKNYDFIFIDCPPSLGAVVSSASLAADYVIIPIDPERFSMSGLKITLEELEKNIAKRYETSLKTKIVLNKFDARTNLSHEIYDELSTNSEYRARRFKSFIRTSQEFPNTISNGKTIFDSLKYSTAKEDIDLLAREFIELNLLNTTGQIDHAKI